MAASYDELSGQTAQQLVIKSPGIGLHVASGSFDSDNATDRPSRAHSTVLKSICTSCPMLLIIIALCPVQMAAGGDSQPAGQATVCIQCHDDGNLSPCVLTIHSLQLSLLMHTMHHSWHMQSL